MFTERRALGSRCYKERVNDSNAYRRLPRVDALADEASVVATGASAALRVEAARAELDAARGRIRAGDTSDPSSGLAARVVTRLTAALQPTLVPVINATGVIVHTNLGRAPLPRDAVEAGLEACTLEYDLGTGGRGSRRAHAERLLTALSGAEAALVVNNNAAAVVLMLSTLGARHEVLISRGELVEIGGSFRVPEIMELAGVTLREVGTTNKTYVSDYENAITEHTGAILRVHPSNYRVEGFAHRPEASGLAALAASNNIAFLHDLGTGTFCDLPAPLDAQMSPSEAVAAGADVVSFSGDKLLGGPQCGILLGRRATIDAMARHPLARALRVGKLTLAVLESVLLAYRRGAFHEVPVARMVRAGRESLRQRARRLAERMAEACGDAASFEVGDSDDLVGGGSHPGDVIRGSCVRVVPSVASAGAIAERLRHGEIPVVVRVQDGAILLSLRTIPQDTEADLVRALQACLATFGDT